MTLLPTLLYNVKRVGDLCCGYFQTLSTTWKPPGTSGYAVGVLMDNKVSTLTSSGFMLNLECCWIYINNCRFVNDLVFRQFLISSTSNEGCLSLRSFDETTSLVTLKVKF